MDSGRYRDISTKRESLMYSPNDTEAFTFMNQSKLISRHDDRVKLTNISKKGHGPGNVFLDITDREQPVTTILELIAQQYPSRIDILIRHNKDMLFLDIKFDPRDTHLDTILQNGAVFDHQIVVIPCTACQVNAVYARLYNLPLLNNETLCDFMFSSLNKYGNLLDFGMLLEPGTNIYMGCGYAIIDTKRRSKAPLSHKVNHPNNGRQFYAVWEGMPDLCYCCHSKNHVFEECSERLTGVIHPEPVFETKMDEKEQLAYKKYELFALNKDREYICVVELNEIYCEELGIPADEIRFFFNRKQLDPSLAFDACNVEDGYIITLV